MSMIMLVTMIAPLVAPILGGYIADWFHWQAIFYLLTVLGLLAALLVWLRIPESLPKERRIPLDIIGVLRNYRTVATNRKVLGYIFTNAFSYSGMFCFLTSGSLVYTGVYGVAPKNFGYFFYIEYRCDDDCYFSWGALRRSLRHRTYPKDWALDTADHGYLLGILCVFSLGAMAFCHWSSAICRDGLYCLEQCQCSCPWVIPSHGRYRQFAYRNVPIRYRRYHRCYIGTILSRNGATHAFCNNFVYPYFSRNV